MKKLTYAAGLAALVVALPVMADNVYSHFPAMGRAPGFQQQRDGANHAYVKEAGREKGIAAKLSVTNITNIESVYNTQNGDNYTTNDGTSDASNSIIGSWIDTTVIGDGNVLDQDSGNWGDQNAGIGIVDSLKKITEDNSSGDVSLTSTNSKSK